MLGADVVERGHLAPQRLQHAVLQVRRAVELLLQHRTNSIRVLGALALRPKRRRQFIRVKLAADGFVRLVRPLLDDLPHLTHARPAVARRVVPQLLQLREPRVRARQPPAELWLTLRRVEVVLVFVVPESGALLRIRLGRANAFLSRRRVRVVSYLRLWVRRGFGAVDLVLVHGAHVAPPGVLLQTRCFRVWVPVFSASEDVHDAPLARAGVLRRLLHAWGAETIALGGVEFVRGAFQGVRGGAPRSHRLGEVVNLVF